MELLRQGLDCYIEQEWHEEKKRLRQSLRANPCQQYSDEEIIEEEIREMDMAIVLKKRSPMVGDVHVSSKDMGQGESCQHEKEEDLAFHDGEPCYLGEKMKKDVGHRNASGKGDHLLVRHHLLWDKVLGDVIHCAKRCRENDAQRNHLSSFAPIIYIILYDWR